MAEIVAVLIFVISFAIPLMTKSILIYSVLNQILIGVTAALSVWIMLRMKPGSSGTGSGALLARMGDAQHNGGAGWEIYQQNEKFIVSLMAPETAPAEEPAAAAAAVGPPAPAPRASAAAAAPYRYPRARRWRWHSASAS